MSAYLDIFNAAPTRRIELIRAQVERSRIPTLAKDLGMQEAALAADLDVRSGSSERIPQSSSERVIGLMSLIGQVEGMIARAGATGFDSAKWLGTRLNKPLPALGGARPGTYLDTMAGQDLLGQLVAMAESGAYA
jgi:hypothetical protein